MSSLVVGVGDCLVSNDPEGVLVTYALGSCIALMIHDPVAGVGGLLHFMLPESSLDRTKAQQNPFMFADTGIPKLFRTAYELGAEKRRMQVAAAGGAQVLDSEGMFNIGKRNHLAMRKILWKAGVMVHAEDVGGTTSRTVRLEVASGRMLLRGAGEKEMPLTATARKGVA
ncbi:MAG TPA: chemotaxis protein CheD [Bryobacteraceae bacterium]|nr:chemotaxis protein CheD [Bryobacteraceae bacterium]